MCCLLLHDLTIDVGEYLSALYVKYLSKGIVIERYSHRYGKKIYEMLFTILSITPIIHLKKSISHLPVHQRANGYPDSHADSTLSQLRMV